MNLRQTIPLSAAVALTVVGCGTDPITPLFGTDAGTTPSNDTGGSSLDGGVLPSVDAGLPSLDTGIAPADATDTTAPDATVPDANEPDANEPDSGIPPRPDTDRPDMGRPDSGTSDGGRPGELPEAIRAAIAAACEDILRCNGEYGYLPFPDEEGCASYLERSAAAVRRTARTPGAACDAAFVAQLECYTGRYDENCEYDYSVDCEDELEAFYATCGIEYDYGY